MVTREVLKTEIDCIQDEYLDVLYRFIKSLEMSLKDLGAASDNSEGMRHARKAQFFEHLNAHRQPPTIRQLLAELQEIQRHAPIDLDIPARNGAEHYEDNFAREASPERKQIY